jgi:hypothetical protein
MMNARARQGLVVTLLAVVSVVAPAAVSGAGFPIATTNTPESHSVATDGTNFLVAIQGGGVRAQLVSPSGGLLGSTLVPRPGDPPFVTFGGTNYLLAWADYTNHPASITVWGQLVSTLGEAVGSPFQISQSSTVNELDGVAFDGTNYFAVWSNKRPMSESRDIYGRFVSTAGAPVGLDFQINDGAGVEASVAFGASVYLVAWTEDVSDTERRARFVTPAGVLQSAFTVNGSSAKSDDAGAAAFDGTNFLVVWTDDLGGAQKVDVLGQRISPAAALVGSVIPIATTPGTQLIPFVAFDGVNYLATWTDLTNDANGNFVCDDGEGTCLDTYGQLVSPSGTLVGTRFTVAADTDNQGLSPVAYGGGQYLAAWSSQFDTPSATVRGSFLSLGSPAGLDFDGDVRADLAVYNPPSGLWYVRSSILGASESTGYGGPDYTPVPGDYDGDTRTDLAVYHPSSGLGVLRPTTTGETVVIGFGGPGYSPVRGDFDGDRKMDLAMYHPPSGLWFVRQSTTQSTVTMGYGGPEYAPVPGDYDGDGQADYAAFHASSGLWFLRSSATGTTTVVGFGGSGYTPVRGDFDGDRKSDVAVYHPPTGLWFIRQSTTGTTQTLGLGGADYVPVAGDYDGDGKTDIAVYHPASGGWFTRSSATGDTTSLTFGGTGFDPVY